MTVSRCSIALLGAVLVSLALPVSAQQPDRAVFLVRLGNDTLAAEVVTIGNGRAEGDMRYRSPLLRVRRVFALSPTFELEHLDFTSGYGPSGDSAMTRSAITVRGDTADFRGEMPGGTAGSPVQRFGLPRGTVHFVNVSGLTLELVLRRARVVGTDSVTVPLLVGPGRTLPALVTRAGPDSAVITLAGVSIRARTDVVGRFLGAVIPSQGAYVDRVAMDSPGARWAPVVVNYDAPPGAPYVAEAVTVQTPAGVTLAGTLTIPAHRAGARLPAVVLITGSGPQDRDEAVPSYSHSLRPFREIADTLSRRGIAVLRLDDRGVGGSSQGPPTATSADYADDIRAALAWARARPDIDPARLGLVGHSEGGIIAPMIAVTDPALRAMVLVAAQAKTGREISAFQRRHAIERDASIPAPKRDSVFAESEKAVQAASSAPGWINFFMNYDPLIAARRVRTPTLVLQGETDTQVTPEQAGTLATAMRAGGNRRVTLRTFPRMNHLMLDDPSGDSGGYGKLPSYAVRRDFLGVLADWLASTL